MDLMEEVDPAWAATMRQVKAQGLTPVVRLWRALYGLARSGFDFVSHFRNWLLLCGWEPIPEGTVLALRDGEIVARVEEG